MGSQRQLGARMSVERGLSPPSQKSLSTYYSLLTTSTHYLLHTSEGEVAQHILDALVREHAPLRRAPHLPSLAVHRQVVCDAYVLGHIVHLVRVRVRGRVRGRGGVSVSVRVRVKVRVRVRPQG